MKYIKIILLITTFNLFVKMEVFPQGSNSPNFTTFTPVGNNDIVNQFNGQLNYSIPIVNVPGPNGSGFQMALSYSSNAKPEMQASWVGFGWELSPGAINRNTKGFPDDYNETNIIYWDKFRKSVTASKNITVRSEVFSEDNKAGLSSNVSYNNINNYSYITSLGFNTAMYGGLKVSWTQKGIPTWSPSLNIKQLENLTGLRLSQLGISESIQKYVGLGLQIANVYPSTSTYYYWKDDGKGQFPSSIQEYSGNIRTYRPSLNFAVSVVKTESEPGFTFTEKIIKPKYETGKSKRVFGYLYSGNVSRSSDLMDYYLEMNFNFDKNDKTLPIPFTNADNFLVTGQGINGSFRFWNSGIGIFRPESVENIIKTSEIGAAFGVGNLPESLNLGLEYGTAESKTSIGKSHISGIEDIFNFKTNYGDNNNIKSSFAMFNNDLGGGVNPYYTSNINYHNRVETFTNDNDDVFSANSLSFNHSGLNYGMDSKIKQSKNISYNTFGDLRKDSLGSNLFSFRSRELREQKDINKDLVAEYRITNEEGKKFNYSLPVFSRNEKNLSYGITKLFRSEMNSGTTDNKIVFRHITPEHDHENGYNLPPEVVLGQEMNEPYANSYLLTEVLSPDYIDLTNDGPSIDDYGTYTEFHYKRTAGTENKIKNLNQDWANMSAPTNYDDSWYKWRYPYRGLNYNKGTHSDPRDNMASVSMGEKEIYYLQSINSKTHVSIFITNKDEVLIKKLEKGTDNFTEVLLTGEFGERKDGFEALHHEWDASGLKDATTATSESINKLRYLNRIVLFKLDENIPFEYSAEGEKIFRVTEIVQTTHFEYDYSTWNELPNSLEGNGKLTLKKVWIENGEVINNLNSPYKFDYTFSNNPLPEYIENMNENQEGVILKENPDYNTLDIDRWGNYRPDNIDEEGRIKKERNWIYQNKNDSIFTQSTVEYEYDPSAHLLKKITLPSRGEILFDYEENNYSYVQDRPAMIMSRLKDNSYNASTSEITLDLEKELGINPVTEVYLIDSIVKRIKDFYVGQDRRIYFKFFYALVGGSFSNSLEYCSNEYIEGFARVDDCFKNPNNEVVVKIAKQDEEFVPKIVCDGFFYNRRYGLYDPDESVIQPCCDVINGSSQSFVYDYLNYDNLAKKLGTSFLPSDSYATLINEKCKTLNESISYLRIPLPNIIPKRGGGVRVKRVLYVDRFEQEAYSSTSINDIRVYGNEYLYIDSSGLPSGVATNEPLLADEENSLVDITKKRIDNGKNYVAGDFMEQVKGPYGKSILPSPSINYSSVIKKNISNQETHPGFQLNNYYTSKDYPFDGVLNDEIDLFEVNSFNKSIQNDKKKNLIGFEYSNLIDGFTKEADYGKSLLNEALSYLKYSKTYVKAAQGFQFISTNFSGKLKNSSTFGGRFEDVNTWALGKKIEYEYFKPGEKQPIVYSDYDIHDGYLGRDIEIAIENRKIDETTYSLSPEVDLGFIFFAPYLFEAGGKIKFNGGSESRYQHMLTNKIISYPAIVKSTKSVLDGVSTVTENIGFDHNSGRPIFTKVATKFEDNLSSNKSIKSLTIPASYLHEGLAQKSSGHTKTLEIRNSNKMGIYRKKMIKNEEEVYILSFDVFWDNSDRFKIIENLSKGDLIKVSPTGDVKILSQMAEFYRVLSVFNDYAQIVPIYSSSYSNASGLPESSMLCKVEIIESGNTNQLTTDIGNITFTGGTNNYIPKSDEYIYSDEYNYIPDPNLGKVKDVKNIFANAINDKIYEYLGYIRNNSLFPNINTDILTNSVNIRNSIIDSTIDVVIPSGGIEVFDIDGNVEILNTSNFSGNNSRLYISDFIIEADPYNYPTTNLNQLIEQKFVRYKFDLVYERYPEKNNISFSGNNYHPYPTALNEILDNAWSIDISDILLNNRIDVENGQDYSSQVFPIQNKVEENVFGFIGLGSLFGSIANLTHLSWTKFEENKNVTNAWKEIYERIGLRDLYTIKMPVSGKGNPRYQGIENLDNINDSYIGEYSEFAIDEPPTNEGDLSIITYLDSETGEYKSYLSRFVLKIKDPDPQNTSSIKVGFKRNFNHNSLISGSYSPLGTIPSDPNNSNIEIIASSYINDIEISNNNDLILLMKKDFKFSQDYLQFMLNDNKLAIDFKDGSTPILFTSDINYYPNIRYRDECRRTYHMSLPQEYFNLPAFADDIQIGSNLEFFIIHNGKLKRNHIFPQPGWSYVGEFDAIPGQDTIGSYLFGSTEADYFCLHFNPMDEEIYSFDDVISSSVVDIKENWNIDGFQVIQDFNSEDPYRNGSQGRWGLESQIPYRDNIDYASGIAEISRNTYDNKSKIYYYSSNVPSIGDNNYNNFILYNWKNNFVNDTLRWVTQNRITSRTKDFQVSESKDILNINSGVRYDDTGIRPIIVSQNAKPEEIIYRSFDGYIDQTLLNPHSGNNVFEVNQSFINLGNLTYNTEKTFIIKIWCNVSYPNYGIVNNFITDPFEFRILDFNSNVVPNVNVVWENEYSVRVGEWQLLSYKISNFNIPSSINPNSSVEIKLKSGVPYIKLYVDDFRLTPYFAISKCFAYDYSNKRILHEFDNEHFKTDYIYDDEGKLVRKVKETYRGEKTIAESFTNIPKENVYNSSNDQSIIQQPQKNINQITTYKRNNRIKVGSRKIEYSDIKNSNSSFDLLDIQIDHSGISNKVFGSDSLNIKKLYQEIENKVNTLEDFGVSIDSLKTNTKYDIEKINLKLEEFEIEKINLNKLDNKLNQIELDSLNLNSEILLDSLEKRIVIPNKEVQVNKKIIK